MVNSILAVSDETRFQKTFSRGPDCVWNTRGWEDLCCWLFVRVQNRGLLTLSLFHVPVWLRRLQDETGRRGSLPQRESCLPC